MSAFWRGADARAAGFLLAFALAFYYPLVFLNRVVVDYDAFVYFQPQRAYLAQALWEGRLPLWNPYLFMGAPFLANPQTAVLYPPSWLFLLGPTEYVYSAQLVLHSFLAAFFMYCFGRVSLGGGVLPSAVGALSFGFGGFAVGQAGHLNQLSAGAWLPAILLAYDRAVARRSPPWAALAGLALATQLLAGHPQDTFMSVVALIVFGLVRAPWTRATLLLWAGGAGVLLGLVGGLVAAAQLLPTLELAPLSIRGDGVQWEDAVAGSLPSYLAVRALLPPFFLDVASTEYLGYGGVVPFVLGFLALLGARSRLVLFGGLLCFLGLFLALGQSNGWYPWLFESVPGFATFRVPARWLFLWMMGLATLATLGAEWIRRGAWLVWWRWDLWPRLLLVVLVLVMGLAWQQEFGEPFARRRTPAVWALLAGATLAAGAMANLGPRPRPLVLAGLVALSGAELWTVADWSPARQAPPAAVARIPAVVDWWRANAGPEARLLSVARSDYIPREEAALRARLSGIPERVVQAGIVATKWRETLIPNLPLQFRIPSADGYDGGVLPLQRFVRMASLLIPADQVRPDGVLISRLDGPPEARLLDLLGITHVLTNDDSRLPGAAPPLRLGDVAISARGGSRALLVFNAGILPDDQALSRMSQSSFDPNQEIVLAPDPAAAQPLASSAPGLPVAAQRQTAEGWSARVTVPAPAYLLQRESWYPGWRARVDGQEVPVLRANLLFRAIPVPAGEHDVEVFFEPASVQRGAVLSLVGLGLAASMIGWPIWRRFLPRP